MSHMCSSLFHFLSLLLPLRSNPVSIQGLGPDPSGSQICRGSNLRPGRGIVLRPHQDENPIFCQDFIWLSMPSGGTVLALMANRSLCLSVSGQGRLVLDTCLPYAPGHDFGLAHNNSGAGAGAAQTVLHSSTNQCLIAHGSNLNLAACHLKDVNQLWIYGSSGRLCQRYGNGCLSVDTPTRHRRQSFV